MLMCCMKDQDLIWFSNCEGCQKALTRKDTFYHLVASPNADILRGINENRLQYSLHREHVVQAPRHSWDTLCKECFQEACAYRPTVPVPQPTQLPTFISKKVESKTRRGRFYEVIIYLDQQTSDVTRMVCNCEWAQYHSNQDQGKTVKWCSHVVHALKEAVDESNPSLKT